MKTRLLRATKALLFTAFVASAGAAIAAPSVTYSGGVATGIQDLQVGSVTYDVDFVFGSFDTVFASQPPTFYGDMPNAVNAGVALRSLLDAQSSAEIGNASLTMGLLLVPFMDSPIGPGMYRARSIGYEDPTGSTWVAYGDLNDYKSIDRSSRNNAFAVFRLDAGSVPEPGSLALMGAALGAGAVVTRGARRRRAPKH